jgi:hypothetical protein
MIPTIDGEYELWSFWLLSLVIWEVGTNISEGPTASIFRVKEKCHVICSFNLILPQKTALGCTQVGSDDQSGLENTILLYSITKCLSSPTSLNGMLKHLGIFVNCTLKRIKSTGDVDIDLLSQTSGSRNHYLCHCQAAFTWPGSANLTSVLLTVIWSLNNMGAWFSR